MPHVAVDWKGRVNEMTDTIQQRRARDIANLKAKRAKAVRDKKAADQGLDRIEKQRRILRRDGVELDH